MNIRILEKLNTLRKAPPNGWDDEMLKEFDSWEKSLEDIDVNKPFYTHPKIREIVKKKVNEVRSIKNRLAADRSIQDPERQKLFERIEILKEVIGELSPPLSEEDIEAKIDFQLAPYLK